MAKKRKNLSRPMVITLVILGLLAMASYYISDYFYKPSFIHFDGFGIDLPVKYQLHGIDVSRYQQDISWTDVKEMNVKGVKIGFAFIKATEGTDKVDDKFRRNWSKADRAGIKKGAYHYFIPSRSGKLQAQHFMETVSLQKGDLPPVLDIEQSNAVAIPELRQRVLEWLTIIEKRYKIKPVIYTNADFYEKYLAGQFDDYPLWVAHYLVKDKPRVKRNWSFWQHNETGRVNGIDAFVDFNVFNGDSVSFQKLLIQ